MSDDRLLKGLGRTRVLRPIYIGRRRAWCNFLSGMGLVRFMGGEDDAGMTDRGVCYG